MFDDFDLCQQIDEITPEENYEDIVLWSNNNDIWQLPEDCR